MRERRQRVDKWAMKGRERKRSQRMATAKEWERSRAKVRILGERAESEGMYSYWVIRGREAYKGRRGEKKEEAKERGGKEERGKGRGTGGQEV
jgi:hypothetical protein